MSFLAQDIGYAMRTLRLSPGFALVATLTLALAIGANATLFALVNAVMLQPAGLVSEPERVVVLQQGMDGGAFSWPDFVDLREGTGTLEAASLALDIAVNVGSAAATRRVTGALVGGGYLDVFGVQPLLGRGFTESEVAVGSGQPVVLVGDGVWRGVLGGDLDALGSELLLNGVSYTVIGVMPLGFQGGRLENPPRLWIPAVRIADFLPQLDGAFAERHWRLFGALGRLAPGATTAMAQAELDAVAARLEEADPSRADPRQFVVHPGHVAALSSDARTSARESLGLLTGVVGLVLLIACLNIATLLLTRATSRRSEIAVRLALGASRRRLVGQLLTESLVLSLCGGGIGLVGGLVATPLFTRFVLPQALEVPARAEPRVLAFGIGLSLLTGIVFGLVPALGASNPDIVAALKAKRLAYAGGRPRRRTAGFGPHGMFVVAQVALSLMLLVGAALLVRTLQQLRAVDPGFDASNVLTASFDPGQAGLDEARGLQVVEELLNAVRPLPGVTAASVTSDLPLDPEGSAMGLYFEGRGGPPDTRVRQTIVADGFLDALRIPLSEGRDFDAADTRNSLRVVIVNEALAAAIWPGESALGKRLGVSGPDGPWYEVVGVAGNHRQESLRQEPAPHLFWSVRQIYAMMSGAAKSIVIRTSGDPLAALPALRREVAELAPEMPLFEVATLRDWLGEGMAREHRLAGLLSGFAAVALALATLGLYGVISYAVAQRRFEIGLRMALGARPRDAARLIVAQGLTLGIAGVVLGLVGSVVATAWMRSFLFGIESTDLATLGAVALAMLVTALLAVWVPARRAAAVAPQEALLDG